MAFAVLQKQYFGLQHDRVADRFNVKIGAFTYKCFHRFIC